MADPNLIGGGRLTRAEVSGDRRQFQASNLSRGALLARFWRYLGKNRGLIFWRWYYLYPAACLPSMAPSFPDRRSTPLPQEKARWILTPFSAVPP